ncbi:protein of unknown function [Nitrospina watsonii]|uniref:Uncharacterized protein n=1 Tax=Nitrospina watsonii TaxID=1323948 RepID=A0ABN8W4D4_9BACT|nr:protein of unknown function [Nitrospina watsonii]
MEESCQNALPKDSAKAPADCGKHFQ